MNLCAVTDNTPFQWDNYKYQDKNRENKRQREASAPAPVNNKKPKKYV